MLKVVGTDKVESVVKHYTPTSTDKERTTVAVKDLSRGAQFVLWSIRKWVQGKTRQIDMSKSFSEAYEMAGVPEAVEVLEEMMALLATTTMRPVLVECPCSEVLSTDEVLLLRSLRALQFGHVEAGRQRVERLIAGRLANAFCRTADVYVHCLQRVGLSLNKMASLTLATQQ